MTHKKAPVFFTIAALTHEPILALAEYWPKIQEDLRKKGYSGPIENSSINVQVDQQPQQTIAVFSAFNPERTKALSFANQGLFAYHTSAYTTRADLFAAFKEGLEVLHQHVKLSTYDRVGVRMLDLIRPSDTGHELSDYVQPALMGFRGLSHSNDWQQGTATLHQVFVDGDAEVTARFDCLPDRFGIQADLFNSIKGHALPSSLTSQSGTLHGILDIDSGSHNQPGRSFELEEVMAELKGHKDRISKVFYESVSAEALKLWGLRS